MADWWGKVGVEWRPTGGPGGPGVGEVGGRVEPVGKCGGRQGVAGIGRLQGTFIQPERVYVTAEQERAPIGVE